MRDEENARIRQQANDAKKKKIADSKKARKQIKAKKVQEYLGNEDTGADEYTSNSDLDFVRKRKIR